MDISRRSLISAGLAGGAGLIGTGLGQPVSAATGQDPVAQHLNAAFYGVDPEDTGDQTARLQSAVDQAAAAGVALFIPPGRYRVSGIALRSGSLVHGVPGATILHPARPGALVRLDGLTRAGLAGLVVDGRFEALAEGGGDHGALIAGKGAGGVILEGLDVRNSRGSGIALERCGSDITDCRISDIEGTGVFLRDGQPSRVRDNSIERCGNNAIQVWRTTPGDDGAILTGNIIGHVAARNGGSGQNGNAINLFRAGGVTVAHNSITDCAFSAVRANAADNVQIVANQCARLGEVALYAEFAFEGAVITQNIVDGAATGVSVTNFDRGGRLAVVQGNLIRDLVRRDTSPDARGVGISVEADSSVTGNVVEGAQTAGLALGWGRYMRDISAVANIIRHAEIGIAFSADPRAGRIHIADNTITAARNGAIRAMDHDRPVGSDLAGATGEAHANVSLGANLVT